jgi:hypothetical protein
MSGSANPPAASLPPSIDRRTSESAFDPLRYCIFTTIALIAWALGPAIATMLMAGLGLLAYGKAWRGGLRRSRCVLGDVRLVLAYLGAAFVAGTTVTLSGLWRLIQ